MPSLEKISAIMITLNERVNLERALPSLSFCDEIIVVDSGVPMEPQTLLPQKGAKYLIVSLTILGLKNPMRPHLHLTIGFSIWMRMNGSALNSQAKLNS